jgi:hypothetical protein
MVTAQTSGVIGKVYDNYQVVESVLLKIVSRNR